MSSANDSSSVSDKKENDESISLESNHVKEQDDGDFSSFESPYDESCNGNNDDENRTQLSPEHFRLAGRTPLLTLFYLGIGPILAQLTGGLKGIIGSIWVSQALGEKALAAISTVGVYDGISRSFGFFLSASCSSKISQLYGMKKEREASQIIVDMCRITVIFGIILPLILGLTIRPLAKWLGAKEDVQDLCYEYMLPINIGTFSTILFIALGGSLQGEGRSMFFSILNIISLVINMAVLDPILLLAIKTGIWGAAFAQAISEAIPGFLLFGLYFSKKFGVKPELSMFLNKFSPHTLPSLKVGLSQLIGNLSQMIPSIIIRKLMALAFGEYFNDGMASFNTIIRIMIFVNSVVLGLTMGFLPAGAYAYAARNYRRWFQLAFHSIWISFVWGTFTAILTWVIPRELSLIFASGEGYLKVCTPMLKYSNALGFIVGGRFCCMAFLQSFQMGILSTFMSLLSNFVSIIVFVYVLYLTNKNDGVRLVWCFQISSAFGLVLGIVFLARPFILLYRGMKEQERNEQQDESEEIHQKDECDKTEISQQQSDTMKDDEI